MRPLPPLGLDSPAAGPAELERGCGPLLPAAAEEQEAAVALQPGPEGLVLSMAAERAGAVAAAATGTAGEELRSRQGRRGGAAAGGGQAAAEAQAQEAHGPAGRARRRRRLGHPHGDIFLTASSDQGRERRASGGAESGREGGRAAGGSRSGGARRTEPRRARPTWRGGRGSAAAQGNPPRAASAQPSSPQRSPGPVMATNRPQHRPARTRMRLFIGRVGRAAPAVHAGD